MAVKRNQSYNRNVDDSHHHIKQNSKLVEEYTWYDDI
jgi:hypothetical protein